MLWNIGREVWESNNLARNCFWAAVGWLALVAPYDYVFFDGGVHPKSVWILGFLHFPLVCLLVGAIWNALGLAQDRT